MGRRGRYNLYEVLRIVKFIESESTLVDARGWGVAEEWGVSV